MTRTSIVYDSTLAMVDNGQLVECGHETTVKELSFKDLAKKSKEAGKTIVVVDTKIVSRTYEMEDSLFFSLATVKEEKYLDTAPVRKRAKANKINLAIPDENR